MTRGALRATLAAIGLTGLLAGAVLTGASPPQVTFVRWQQAQGLFSADVPAGWRVEGAIDPQGLANGAFRIEGFSPDGRSMFTFAHNWISFMEYQHGRYRPGHATVETLVVPALPSTLSGMGIERTHVTYRSPNAGHRVVHPETGLALVGHTGTLGLLATTSRREVLAGTLTGETLYIPLPGTPGLWRLRVFTGALAPATPVAQANVRAIVERVVGSLRLSPEFRGLWDEGHQRTTQTMREFSAQQDRMLARAASVRESRARAREAQRADVYEEYAELTRGGHYERDPHGSEYWVGNESTYWFRNERGHLVGNDTGTPPPGGTWTMLARP